MIKYMCSKRIKFPLLINIDAFPFYWRGVHRRPVSSSSSCVNLNATKKVGQHSTCTVCCYHTLLKIETYIHSTFHTDYNGPLVLFSKMSYIL